MFQVCKDKEVLRDAHNRSGLSSAYSKYRPCYPDELYDTIMTYMSERLPGPYQQAVDVGCGSGQNTQKLAEYFNQVQGSDISESQLSEAVIANLKPNVTYRCAACDNLPVPDSSTDLVTCATSAHWFEPIEDFYTEVDRVLKPNGVLAMFGYTYPRVQCEGYDSGELSYPIWQFHLDERNVRANPARGLKLVAHYKGIVPPYKECNRHEFTHIQKDKTFGDILGYLGSMPYYWTHMEQHPDDKSDPLKELESRFRKIIGDGFTLETECTMVWPMFMVIARKAGNP